MRIIEKCWVDLKPGYEAALSFEARLKRDWKRSIQVAQKRETRTAITKRSQVKKIAGVIFLLFLFLCALSWIGIFYLPDSRGQLLSYFCALTFAGILSGGVYLFYRGNPRVTPHPSLDLMEAWWKSLRPKRYVIRTHGGRAEVEFLKSLSFLDNHHVAIWGLLTSAKRTSDTDVLLLGPTGIWIFEVKYWNGILSKQNGVWFAEYKWGGRKTYEKSPDEQWLAQKNEIKKTIQMRLRSKPWLTELIKGGVVFAHPDAVFGQITGYKSAYGKPGAWRKRIRETKPIREFRIEDQLQLLDALILYANQHEKEEFSIVSAGNRASQLYEQATAALRKYVLERVK